MVAEDDAAFLLRTFAATIVQAGVRCYLARKHFVAQVFVLVYMYLNGKMADHVIGGAEDGCSSCSEVLATLCMAQGLCE